MGPLSMTRKHVLHSVSKPEIRCGCRVLHIIGKVGADPNPTRVGHSAVVCWK